MFSCLLERCHGLIIYMLRLSSDGDICASVSHDAAAAPTLPTAVGKHPSPAPVPLSLSFSQSLCLSLSLPWTAWSPEPAGEGLAVMK